MSSKTQSQILDVVVGISLHVNAFGKDLNPPVIPSAIGKKYGRLDSLALVRQLIWEKKNSEFKPALLHLGTDHVSHPANGKGFVLMLGSFKKF